jgi:2-polyprenyl-3-methyl-5-hydroxy-6-metoxy-1,4-benzoquinol methylase
MTASEEGLVPLAYWEERARRFARRGSGLGAVCSYGMPGFYNAYIHLVQLLALRSWLRVPPGTRILEVGCGVGRWGRRMARRGARVTGIDLAPQMIEEARRRAERDGVAGLCRFLVADLAALALEERFERILGVTVLQHILDRARFEAAVERLSRHLAPGGRLILLEAAPSRRMARCDSSVFVAREVEAYRSAFAGAGLRCIALRGVDPVPLKTLFMPWYGRLPRALALAGLAATTMMSLPVDALFGRRLTDASWHKVFVLQHAGDAQ